MMVSWSALKTLIESKSHYPYFVEDNENLYIFYVEDSLQIQSLINKNIQKEDLDDFNTNFRSLCNQSSKTPNIVKSMPAFAAKTFETKRLYKRVHGIRPALSQGSNDILWEMPYAWAKFMSIEIIGAENGDYCSLYVLDSEEGLISTIPNYVLNQFGFEANIAKDFYCHKSEFDADLYAGLQVKIVYNSVSAKSIGINFVMNELKD